MWMEGKILGKIHRYREKQRRGCIYMKKKIGLSFLSLFQNSADLSEERKYFQLFDFCGYFAIVAFATIEGKKIKTKSQKLY